MSPTADPVLAALAAAAVDVTAASAGWIVAVDDERLVVAAVSGDTPADLVGTEVPAGVGAVGYAVASGQPLALAASGGDVRAAEGLAAALGRPPSSTLCVPCETDDGVVGALEVVEKIDGASFSFDDVELATLLAGIAAVAVTVRSTDGAADAPSPDELAGAIGRLAADDPGRYRAVASLIASLTDRA